MKIRYALAAILLSSPALAQGTPPSITAPTSPSQAANKAYVDSAVGAVNSIATSKLSDAPSDSQVYGRSNGAWAAIGAGGSASVTNSSVIAALGYTPANKAGDTFPGTVFTSKLFSANSLAMNAPNCLPGDGTWAQNSSAEWVPSCWGAFFSPLQTDIPVNPTRGTISSNDVTDGPGRGTPNSGAYTYGLIQGQADGGTPRLTNGLTVNFDVVGGSYSAAPTDPAHPEKQPNASAAMISVAQRRGPNGEHPASTWGLNIDTYITANSGTGFQTYGMENDLNNSNCDSNIGSACGSAWFFYGGINAYPNLAFHYIGNPITGKYQGTMTRSGNQFIADGGTFNPLIKLLTYNDPFSGLEKSFRVDCTTTVCTADMTVGTDTTNHIPFVGVSAMAHIGMFFQDHAGFGTQVADHDFFMNDAAANIMYANGHHKNGLDFYNDDLKNAMLLKPGQQICYNATNSCSGFSTALQSWLFQAGNDQSTNVARIGTNGDAYFAGNISSSTVNTTGAITASGNISGGAMSTTGTFTAVGNISSFAGINAGGTVSGGNISTPGNLTTSGTTTTGNLTVTGRTHTTGHTTSELTSSYQCAAASKGEWTYVTDLSSYPGFRNTFWTAGGSVSAPVWCNGVNWELH